MAGRIAEEICDRRYFQRRGHGHPAGHATWRAPWSRQWGMSDKLGMVQYGDDDEFVFLGREMSRTQGLQRSKPRRKLTRKSSASLTRLTRSPSNSSTANRDKLELIANALLEYETLDGAQVEEIVRTGKFTPPPPTPGSRPADGRAGRHAAARNAAQTRAAAFARPGHARARAA